MPLNAEQLNFVLSAQLVAVQGRGLRARCPECSTIVSVRHNAVIVAGRRMIYCTTCLGAWVSIRH